MKGFDLFQKITVETSSKSTILGAIISLIALSLMGFIFIKQIHEYFFKPLITKNSIIFQDVDGTSSVAANLGIVFNQLPCSIISVDQEDLIGHHRLNIKDTLYKTSIDSQKNPNNHNFDAHVTKDLLESLNKKEGCIVSGHVPISKVKGDIHISFHAYRDIYSYILNNRLSKEVRMAHSFSLLNFGDGISLKKVLSQFQMEELESNFNRSDNLPNNEAYGPEYDFDYFIKIIPQIFENKYTSETLVAYQYSLTYKAKVRKDPMSMPIVIINYDYSPVAVKYTMERRYFLHLLTDICALIGGIFVIFSILNNVLLRLFDKITEEPTVSTSKSIN